MNDNYKKFEFEIQLLHICHESNGDSDILSVYIRFIHNFIVRISFIHEHQLNDKYNLRCI